MRWISLVIVAVLTLVGTLLFQQRSPKRHLAQSDVTMGLHAMPNAPSQSKIKIAP